MVRGYAFPQTPLGKSGPCGAVAPGQCVATGQCFPGSRYARPRWISVFGATPGEAGHVRWFERALPGTAERQLRLRGPHRSERLLRRMGRIALAVFRVWWRALTRIGRHAGQLAHLMRLAGRFGRRVLRATPKLHDIPVVDCVAGQRKHDVADDYLARTTVTEGLFLVLVGPRSRHRCGT